MREAWEALPLTDREKQARKRRYTKDPSWISKPLFGYEFARRMAVSETTVKRWEKTGIVGPESAPKVSAALSIPLEEITATRRRTSEEQLLDRLTELEETGARAEDVQRLERVLTGAIESLAKGDAPGALRVLSELEASQGP